MEKSIISFKTLVVITPEDCQRLLKLYPRLVEAIDYGEIVFVGRKEVERIIRNDIRIAGHVEVVDENSIIPFDEVHAVIKNRMAGILRGRDLPRGITGWYYQQFLKMQYALTCGDEYYMTWDGDTIPCKKIKMFEAKTGKPYLDLKYEYHKEYFETLDTLLPGYKKLIKKSFISEHMLFKTEIMKQLISDIESNKAIIGGKFWEKIINSIPEDKIQSSSFSEFETYGTYVMANFGDVYALRDWHSFRLGGEFFSIDTIKNRDFKWLSRDFFSISFEKGHSVRPDNANLFDNPRYQEKISARLMLEEAQKEYQDGYKEIWSDDEGFEEANVTTGQFNNKAKKLIFLDWNNDGPDYLDQFFDTSKVMLSEIFTIDGSGIGAENIPLYEGWDYLVVSFNKEQEKEIMDYLAGLGIPLSRIILVSESEFVFDNPEIAQIILA